MADPPLVDDAVHVTTDWLSAFDVAVTAVGAEGAVAGTTADVGAEAALVPEPLVAVTVTVEEVPLVRPVTVQLVEAVAQVLPPGLDVTV
jgi:hypothetical protein